MAIGDDFSITPQLDGTHEIDYTGAATYYTGLELYRWLQELADDQNYTGDDIVDISFENVGARATDTILTLLNGFYITSLASQHLYNASITQRNGDEIYSGLQIKGTTENSGGVIQIVQDGALVTDFWTGGGENAVPASQILLQIMLLSRTNGADIDGGRILTKIHHLTSTYAEFPVELGEGVAVGALSTTNDLNNQTAEATIATWSDIVITEGLSLIDVDNNTVDEEYFCSVDLGSRTKAQLFERGKWLTREGSASTLFGMDGELFRGITHSMGYDNEGGTPPFTQNEVIVWGTSFAFDGGVGTFTQGEYVEDTTSGAVGKLVYYSGAGATGTMIIAKEPGSGTIADPGALVGLTSGATANVNGAVTGNAVVGGEAALLAIDDDGVNGNLYVQLLTGVAPLDNDPIRGRTSGTTADVNGSPVARTITPVWLGATTGTAIIGSYGFGIEEADLIAADLLTALDGNARNPPDNQTFSVNGCVVGEDYVKVGPRVGSAFDLDQFTGATGSNASGASTWVVNEAIPAYTPASGTVRVFDGFTYKYEEYDSWTGSTFTLSNTLGTAGASHTLNYDNEASGPFTLGETLTFGGGGTAELLNFIDGLGAGTDEGRMVVRMISGSVPADNESITGGTSSATGDVNGTPGSGRRLLVVHRQAGYLDDRIGGLRLLGTLRRPCTRTRRRNRGRQRAHRTLRDQRPDHFDRWFGHGDSQPGRVMPTLQEIKDAISAGRRTSWKRDDGHGLVTTEHDTWGTTLEWLVWACPPSKTTRFHVCLLNPETERVEVDVHLDSSGVSVTEA